MIQRNVCPPIAGLFLLLAFCVGVRAENVQLDDESNGVAVSQDTGAVCVINTEKNQASLYPVLSSHGMVDGRIDRAVGRQPNAVLYRRLAGKSYFIVSCADRSLWVLDAEKLTVIKTVEIAQVPASISAAVKGDSPYIFYGFEGSLGCVDLRDWTDHPNLIGSSGMTSFMDIGASADGHLVYSRGLQRSPSGRTVCSIEDTATGAPVVKDLGYQHTSVSDFVPDPFGPYCAYIASYGMGPDPYLALPDLKSGCSWIMQSRPLILVDNGTAVFFYSYNTLKQAGTLTLNGNGNGNANPQRNRAIRANQRPFNPGSGHKLLVDEKNGNVLIWSGASINVIELSQVDLPAEPLLGVNITGATVLHPDAPAGVALKKLNPDSKIELVDPRDGMKLDSDTLRWTPAGSDVGTVPVKVRISANGFERVQQFSLTVRRPELDLPFVPQESVMSADGQYILLLQGSPPSNGFQQRGMPGQAQIECKLALVHASHQTIVRVVTMPRTVHCIAVDASHAYAAATDSDAIYMYSLKDLSEERKVFAVAPVRQISAAGGRLFVISQQNSATEYSLPDLKPVNSSAHVNDVRTRIGRVNNNQLAAPGLCENGWRFDGVLFDSDFKRVVRLENPGDFVGFPAPARNPNIPVGYNPNGYNQQLAPLTSGWGLTVQGDRLMRSATQSLGTIQGADATFLQDLPALATLQVESRQNQGSPFEQPQVSTTLNLYDLISAGKKQSIVLSDEQRQPPQQTYPGQPSGQSLLSARGRLAALIEDKLYFIDLSKLDHSKFNAPPQINCEPGPVTFDPGKTSAIEVTSSHIKGPVQFMLDPDVKGVAIDPATGKLTITGPDLIPQATEALKRAIIERINAAQAGLSSQQVLDGMIETADARYTALTGATPAGGLPMLLRLNVSAIDADQQKISCTVGGFVFIPIQDVLAAVDAQQEQLNQAMDQQGIPGRRVGRPRATTQRAGSSQQEQIDKLNARVAELEKLNTELSAQNKMLKDMVMEQKKNPQ